VLASTIVGQPLFRGSISGTVVDYFGRPLKDVEIEVYSGNLLVKLVMTQDSGMFYIELDPGTYSVTISKEGFETITKSIRITARTAIDLGTIKLGSALKVSMFPSQLRLNVGQKIQVPIVVKNAGELDLTCNINISSEGLATKVLFSGLEVNSFLIASKETKNLVLEIGPCYKTGLYSLNIMFIPSHGYLVNKTLDVEVYESQVKFLTCDFPAKVFMLGENMSFDVMITNPFDIDAIVSFNISYPEGWVVFLSSALGERIKGLSIKARGSTKLKICCRAPSRVSGGVYEVKLVGTLYNSEYQLNVTNELTLKVYIEKGNPLLSVSVETPVLDVYSGSQARFELSISNLGTGDAIVDLRVENLPSGFWYNIQDLKGNVISSIYLSPSATKKVILIVRSPYGEEPHIIEFNFVARARSGSEVRVSLGLNILGRYEMSYKTELSSMEMEIGGTSVYQLTIENTGANELTNVKLVIVHLPQGFNASISPDVVESLKPKETCTFTITVSSSGDLNAGDYYMTVKVVSDQVETDTRQIRISLYQRSEIVYIALIVLVIAIIVVSFVYHKYGRR